jgi:hypothetical protein
MPLLRKGTTPDLLRICVSLNKEDIPANHFIPGPVARNQLDLCDI